MIINTNMAAMNTIRQLGINEKNTQSALAKLSSGLRINSAADDAAGLAISQKMQAQIRGLNQASRNAQDGISLIQTGEGALNETQSILQRMRELATQAANDTNTADDRNQIQIEVNQLSSEINRIGNTTQFNTMSLLSGNLNVTDAVAAKLSGGQVTGPLNILTAATSASAAGAALTGAATQISAIGGPTVTGTKAFTNPSSAGSGPDVTETSAVATGDTLTAQNIGEFAPTVTGSVAYANHASANSGPTVSETSATATGSIDLETNSEFRISGSNYLLAEGTKTYTTAGTAPGEIVGPNVTTSDNEIQFSLNGTAYTAAIAAHNYDGASAGNGVAQFATDLQTAMQAAGGAATAGITVNYNSSTGKIEIQDSNTADTFSVDGGGLITTHLLANPTDTMATQTIGQNNTLTTTINGSTKTMTLTAGTYDLTTGTGQTAFLADLQTKLNGQYGAGNVTASFDLSGHLKLTDAGTTGDSSTITSITGNAAASLGLNNAAETQGTENNILTMTYNGTQKTITLSNQNGTESADTFLTDLQNQINSAYGAGKITVSFDSNNKIQFQPANYGDTLTIDSGGAQSLIGTTTTNTPAANNTLELNVNGTDKTLTLSGNYTDLTSTGTQQAGFLTDLQGKLDTAFGAGNVTASFSGNKLVLTDNTTGTASTISVTGGTAASALGVTGQSAQGTEKDQLTLTYDGTQKTLTLAQVDYSNTGSGKGASDFITDIQNKLNTAFGTGNINVSLDANNKVVFTAKNASDTLSVDGGGAVSLLKANSTDSLATGVSGNGNNTLNLTVNGTSKSITLANGTYDFTNAANKTTFLTDLNSKLDTAFGTGNVVASFDANNKLTLTDSLTGTASTINNITGTAVNSLGLNTVTYTQGQNANNTGTLTVDGKTVNISLSAGSYSGDTLASTLQSQIRAADPNLIGSTVNFVNNAFTITSGSSGVNGSVSISAGDLANALKLDSTDATYTAGINAADNGLKFQIGANAGQTMTIGINDMRSLALKATGNTANGTVTASDGQVASYVGTTNVTNGSDNNNVEYSLDLSTSKKATAAISVLGDAINSVSSERAKLGAYQNRLVDTIDNLGTASQNLTAASSTITDVDMAAEMTVFQKDNILQQAAQAMLAQANQLPQGILQLLR